MAGKANVIDHDALDEIMDASRGVRAGLATGLNERYVPGEGDNPQAFIVGEAPGANEALKLRPFVGPAGTVLRELMSLAGLCATDIVTPNWNRPANCWITNVCKFRPPMNRNPTEMEIRAFRPLLFSEWHAVGAPSLIIPVGGIALRAVTGKYVSILRAAGKCHYYKSRQGRKLAIWPMVHPSFGIRNPPVQPLLEQDWEALADWRIANPWDSGFTNRSSFSV